MKLMLMFCGALLVAGVTGCSPDGALTEPPVVQAPAGIPGPANGPGEWMVDRLVYDPDRGQLYHVKGAILYAYAEDGLGFEFTTDVKMDVSLLHTPEPGGGSIAETVSEKGSVSKSGKVTILRSYSLPGLDPSAVLRLRYDVGAEGCVLSDVSLFIRPVETTER